MDYEIREYIESDYKQCSELVCRAWAFDSVFRPDELTALAKDMYTGGALTASTFKSVAVSKGEVIGFIFGMNRTLYKARINLKYRLSMLWKINKIRSSSPNIKDLIRAITEHERNRSVLVPKKRSEVVLFVVADSYQGKGVGKALWNNFAKRCCELNESEVYVETNKRGASRFYENIGFRHLSNFDSPLHEIATPSGQACIYVYDIKA